jgi:pimeloyl-ACP methyl ester carboxylesterase
MVVVELCAHALGAMRGRVASHTAGHNGQIALDLPPHCGVGVAPPVENSSVEQYAWQGTTACCLLLNAAVERGRDLLRRMPYNLDAVEWSARAFDDSYVSRWWPRALPTLILSGADDRIVDQSLWQHPAFCGPNVLHRTVAQAGHFPWIEQPAAVGAALDELAAKITSERRL